MTVHVGRGVYDHKHLMAHALVEFAERNAHSLHPLRRALHQHSVHLTSQVHWGRRDPRSQFTFVVGGREYTAYVQKRYMLLRNRPDPVLIGYSITSVAHMVETIVN